MIIKHFVYLGIKITNNVIVSLNLIHMCINCRSRWLGLSEGFHPTHEIHPKVEVGASVAGLLVIAFFFLPWVVASLAGGNLI